MRKILYFLGTLTDSDLDWLITQGVKTRLVPGSTLIQKGTDIDSLYILLDGVL